MPAERQYNMLLANGDLLDLYPGLTGEWNKDKKVFAELYEMNRKAINDIDVSYGEEY